MVIVSSVLVPAQISASPVITAEGTSLTVTTASPERSEGLASQPPLLNDLIVYVVLISGFMEIIIGLPSPSNKVPSDNSPVHGPVPSPVTAMLNSLEVPAHKSPPPLNTAVGLAVTVISAVPEKLVLVQFRPLKLVME